MRVALVVTLLLASLAAVVALPTAADDGDPSPALRVATFDLGRVDEASRRKKDGMVAIEAKFSERKKEFEKKQARLRNMLSDLRGSVYRPGSPEHQRLAVEAQNLEREVKREGFELTRDIGDAKGELLHAIYADLQLAIDALASAEGYDLVLQVQKPSDTLSAPEMARQLNAMAVFHAHPRFDVTDRLVAAMNAAYEKE
jgi:Skp family chaperone for outer membrane proteins